MERVYRVNNHGGSINGAKILKKYSYLGDGSRGFHGLLEFPPVDLVHARSLSTRARLEIEEGESPFFPSPSFPPYQRRGSVRGEAEGTN